MGIIVGIAGGSASGKTFIAKKANEGLGKNAIVLSQDLFYKESSQIPKVEGLKNFDCPEAFDWPLIKEALLQLKAGKCAIIPEYNYLLGRTGYKTIEPKEIIIFEGILALQNEKLNCLFDLKFFVNAPEKIRLERRLKRDFEERKISKDEIKKRFFKHVRKSHCEFVQPQEKTANLILDGTKKAEFARVVREIESIAAKSKTQPDSIEIESHWDELSFI